MTTPDQHAPSRLLADCPTNWGRWGAEDELGALNFLTADYWEPGPTFSPDLVMWFHRMEIPCLVTDTLANETTYEPNTGIMLPLHGALMRNLGIVFTEAA